MKRMLFVIYFISHVCFSQNSQPDANFVKEVDYTEVIQLFAAEAEIYLQKQADSQSNPQKAMSLLLEKRNQLSEKLIKMLGETEQEKRINYYFVLGSISGAYHKVFPEIPDEFYDKVQKKIRKF